MPHSSSSSGESAARAPSALVVRLRCSSGASLATDRELRRLLSDRIGAHAELAFVGSLAAGELVVEPVLDSDWGRIAELIEQYIDLPLGMVDASVVALAERRGLETIATLDERHFRVVRPRHTQAFTLVP